MRQVLKILVCGEGDQDSGANRWSARAQKYQQLDDVNREAKKGGGTHRIESQHKKGKLTARERLDLLMDKGSFNEIGRFVTHRSSEFGLEKEKYLGDGVVTGYGTINGRLILRILRKVSRIYQPS